MTYVDTTAVERRCRGDRSVPLNRSEALEAWIALERRRLSAPEIGARLGRSERTIRRWRACVTLPVSLPAS